VVIRLHTDPENRGTGAYQLLTPYTHGVPHVDCEGPSAVTRTSLLLPPGRKTPEPARIGNRTVYLEKCNDASSIWATAGIMQLQCLRNSQLSEERN
jgi:hypothetical protein